MSKSVKTVLISVIAALLLLILVSIMWGLWFCYKPILYSDQSAITFVVPKGASAKSIAVSLQQQKILASPRFFMLLVYLSGTDKSLQSGEYSIEPGTSLLRLLHKLVNGSVTLYSFTVVNGWTFHQTLKALDANKYVTHTMGGLSDEQIMSMLGHEGEIPEGRFYPETYEFARGTKDTVILLLAYKLMQNKLDTLWEDRSPDVSYSCPYKALIVASMIEKETAVPQEKSMISGVIQRRLKKDMFLQIDASLIYGLGDSFIGPLKSKDLSTDTPYNTYMHKGLLPTPICMPNVESIYAALHPDNSDFLYYVAKGNGSHIFSNTLDEHNLAVQKYILNSQ